MNSRRNLLLIVMAAAFVVYANSLWNGFAYDDTWIIFKNPHVHHLGRLRDIWLLPYWPNYGAELGLYRPLTIFLFAIQWQIGAGAPWLFHLVNVLAHVACSALVFLLIELLMSRRAAFAGALLFAVHPLHTEAVANVVGQSEIWACLCVLAACLIYIRRPEGAPLSRARLCAILALYAAGLLVKESAVVLPGLLLLLDVVQKRARFDRNSAAKYINSAAFTFAMLTVVLCAYMTLRVSVLGNFAGTDAAPGLPFLREQYRLLNAFRAWPEYVRLLFFPLTLSVDYAPATILPVETFTPMTLLGLALVAATVVLTFMTPRRPVAGLIAGWFLITILPVSNFLFPIGVLIAERTLYLPSVAVCLLAGLAWEHARRSTVPETRRLVAGIGIFVVAGFGLRTVVRNPDWDSLDAVWDALIRDHPESYHAQWARASRLWVAGDAMFAEKYYLLAHRIWPRDSQLINDFGNFYISQRRYHDAVAYLERSREMSPFVVHTYESLAYAYLYDDRPADALRTAWHAIALGGTQNALMYAVIAGSYEGLGKYERAVGAWRVATTKKGGGIWLYWGRLARALAWTGRTDAALAAVDSAYAHAGGSEPIQAIVEQLRTAIRTGCYPGGVDCDVLNGWILAYAASPPSLANSNTDAKRKKNAAAAP